MLNRTSIVYFTLCNQYVATLNWSPHWFITENLIIWPEIIIHSSSGTPINKSLKESQFEFDLNKFWVNITLPNSGPIYMFLWTITTITFDGNVYKFIHIISIIHVYVNTGLLLLWIWSSHIVSLVNTAILSLSVWYKCAILIFYMWLIPCEKYNQIMDKALCLNTSVGC